MFEKSAYLPIKLVILLIVLVILVIYNLDLFFNETIFLLWKPSTLGNSGSSSSRLVEIFGFDIYKDGQKRINFIWLW